MKKTLILLVLVFMVVLQLSAGNWDNGERRKIKKGDTLICEGLATGQVYCVFLYNISASSHEVEVNVQTATEYNEPNVIGTSDAGGPGYLVFFHGNHSSYVKVFIDESAISDSQIEAWIGSRSLPKAGGFPNEPLPAYCEFKPFDGYKRYFFTTQKKPYEVTITTQDIQFVCTQFYEDQATLYLLLRRDCGNLSNLVTIQRRAKQYIVIRCTEKATISDILCCEAIHYVWMNGDTLNGPAKPKIRLCEKK